LFTLAAVELLQQRVRLIQQTQYYSAPIAVSSNFQLILNEIVSLCSFHGRW